MTRFLSNLNTRVLGSPTLEGGEEAESRGQREDPPFRAGRFTWKMKMRPFVPPYIVLFCLSLSAQPLNAEGKPEAIPTDQIGHKYQLIGKLGVPLGTIVRVEGVLVEGDLDRKIGAPYLQVHRIDGKPVQQEVRIRIEPYYNEWGKEPLFGAKKLPALVTGALYEMEGYETGAFGGMPEGVWEKAGVAVQSGGDFGFGEHLEVYDARLIKTPESH